MIKALPRLRALKQVAHDQSGVVAPSVAVMGVALVAAAGLALDVGLYYMDNRDLRSATEAAALSAAVNPANAHSRATDYLVKNGFAATDLKSLEVGYYCANIKTRTAGARFLTSAGQAECPGASVQNAVRLTTEKDSRRFLSTAVGLGSAIPKLTATASAGRIDEAGISITTGLLTITNSLVVAVNELLGALLGIKLHLNSTQVEALMGGNVDAGKFFDALAKRSGQSGTYGDLMLGTYGMQDIAYAAADAAYNTSTKGVLTAVGAATSNAYKVPFTQNGHALFGLGLWENTPVGGAGSPTALRAGLNSYQLLSYIVQAGPGVIDLSNVVSLVAPDSVVEIAAVATGNLDRPRFSFGPAGETTVGTSMLRLMVNVNLLNLGIPGLVGAKAHVPLVLDVAGAYAEIPTNGIECNNQSDQKKDTRVTLNTNSGLVNAYVGELKDRGKISKFMPALHDSDFNKAEFFKLEILYLGLRSIRGMAVIKPVIGVDSRSAYFGRGTEYSIGGEGGGGDGLVVGNKLSVGLTVSGLANTLLSSDDIESCTLNFLCYDPTQKSLDSLRSVLDMTGNLLGSTVDPLLDNVLAALGVQLGHATVWVNGARCGVPVLI